jgi:prepilin peptidase CpaA
MIVINIILFIALAVSFVTDLKFRRILNIVTFPAILAGLMVHSMAQGWEGFLFSGLGLMTGMATLLIPFLLGGMGAGDVKLMGAVGALMGTAFTLQAFVVVALIGGLISLLLIVKQNGLLYCLKSLYIFPALLTETKGTFFLKPNHTSIAFPYGIPIVLGTIFTFVWGGVQ